MNIKEEIPVNPGRIPDLPVSQECPGGFENEMLVAEERVKEEKAKPTCVANEVNIIAYQNMMHLYNHVAQYQTICLICDKIIDQESIKIYCVECSESDYITVNLDTYKPPKVTTEGSFPKYSESTDDKLNGQKVKLNYLTFCSTEQ
jgi:hypothetical protein